MNSLALVSVLIRTKDRKSLLCEAIDSVLAQNYSSIEIIIINDGGADYSTEILADYADQPRNIRWLNNAGQHGRSHAANLALEDAQGEFCLFLDDDDSIDPEHIANLTKTLSNQDIYSLAYSAVRVIADGIAEEVPSFAHPFDPVRLMIENYIPIHAVLFKRSLLSNGIRFDPAFDRFEDWDFWLQLAQQHAFKFINKCTASYRVDNSSGFGAKDNIDNDMDAYRLAVYKKWLALWSDEKIIALLNRSREFPRISVLEKSLENLGTELTNKLTFISELSTRLDDRDRKILSQQKQIGKKEQKLQAVGKALQESEKALQESENEATAQKNLNQALSDELQVIYNSRSWKLTRPLRALTIARYFIRTEGVLGLFARLRTKHEPRLSHIQKIKVESPVSDKFSTLSFPVFEKPSVSIVIPVFNKYQYTFHCLKSILDHTDEESYEVIVVDDLSSDKTQTMLAGIKGITVISNEENLGFINSCNKGAESAKGQFLLLLNNDTEVRDGWLKAMRQTFQDFPDAGLVGARLEFADGTLQEAGGIVWQDGSAWNYGRGDDPNNPMYNYCRQVDYCSGACLMIPLNDFSALGGFDTHYVPAYYEDTDLAFKVRETGKKVYYQPNATLTHFEGVTSGTDTGSGIKKYQQINHKKFFSRWEETLKQHRPNARLPYLEKERHVQKRILIIDARVLMPDRDSGSLRMFNILKILQNIGYKVTFFPANLHCHNKYTPQMQAIGIECLYVPYVKSIGNYLEEYGQYFNAVILSRADTAEMFIDDVKQYCTNAKIIFDTVDLHFLREEREAKLTRDKILADSAAMRKTQELALARKADTTLVVSPVELDLFKEEAPDVNVNLLSNIHQLYETGNSFKERKDILFIGGFEHPPNTDAMLWFLDAIFPIVQKENPDIRLIIIGGHVPEELKNKANDSIIITGFVGDIKPLFDKIRLSIAPLRYGAGVKGKINSSMSFGVPVVATNIAAEGMKLVHEKDVLIADEPEEFTREIMRLYFDATLWQALSEAGKQNIEEHFSFATAEAQLRAVL